MGECVSFDTIRGCLIDALELNDTEAGQLNEHTSAADLAKWDSLTHLTLVVQLEECFGVEFDDDEVLELGSVRAIWRALEDKKAWTSPFSLLSRG